MMHTPIRPTSVLLALAVLWILPRSGAAQQSDFEDYRDFFSRTSWETASYGLRDHTGYEHYGYLPVPYGGYVTWEYEPEPGDAALPRRPDLTHDELYVGRTGGVYRGEWMTPDEIGRTFRENGLFFGHMGSSLVETEWILKKYGLRHLEKIPGHAKNLGLSGFQPEDYDRYRDSLQTMMERHREEIRDREAAYNVEIIDNPETKWLLTGSGIMHLFLDSLENNYDDFNRTFRRDAGYDIPLNAAPSTPRELARHSRFIQWVRTRMHGLMALQMEVFRDVIDPAGQVISNVHGEDVIDFEQHGAIVDHPGPAARAQFSNREMVLQYWNGYIFRLWRDLTDRRLFASSRINNGVVRARSIPNRAAVELWHNQGLQNGAIGFYQWLKDYGPRDAEGNKIETPTSFDGPAFANPDPSTRGQERWETVLDISRTLAHTRTFDPPTSETGILVAFDNVNVDGWDRIFSAYVELTKAEVWSSFVSDREILDGTEDLRQWKVIYVPTLEFADRKLAQALTTYVEQGGVLVSMDPEIFRWDMDGEDLTEMRQVFGIEPGLKRRAPRAVRLTGSDARVLTQQDSWEITPLASTGVIGIYPDGSPAVTSRQLGDGQAIFWGVPLADVYVTHPFADPDLDGRGTFYKDLEGEQGIEDYSWIWDITFRNLHQVTDRGEPDLPPVKSEIPLN